MKKLYLFLMILLTTCICYAQGNGQLIKVSEFCISNITTIEERVFMIHYITDKGYLCKKNNNAPNTIDVYISNDAHDDLSDFDFFYNNLLYDQLNELSYLDKTQRGELFVEWEQNIDNELYEVLYDDFSENIRFRNASCDGALPFYTGNGAYNFPASVNAGNLGSNTSPYFCSGFIRPNGETTNCLSTTPNPAFYFMRISEPGNLVISIHSEPQYDIDFDCWGPFYDINTVCDLLSCGNMVDCSYSASATEYCYIDNAQTGQYYMLLITNYSNQECNIIFENLGSGATEPIAKVTLTAGDVWGDGTGYQMLLDADANTLGTTIPYVGALSPNCTGNEAIYYNFEHKIPTNADGNCSTSNIVLNNSKTITIPAGTYDWCVTNPTPGDRIWIAGSGRGNNTEFEIGKAYEFTATMKNDGHDIVNAIINNGDIDPYILNVSANPNYGGFVVGGGTFVQGQYCNPIAYSNESYSLFSWTENGLLVATSANYSFPIAENRSLVANFVPAGGNKCTLVFDLYDSYGDGWNNAKLDVAFNNGLPAQHITMFSGSSASYELEVNDGAVVTLTWTPGSYDSECSFNVHYEDGTIIYQGSNLSSSFSYSFQMDCPGSTYEITVSASPTNGGSVTGGGTYQQGQQCTVSATHNTGYTFSSWKENGQVVSTSANYTFTVNSNRNLVAHFTQQQYTITTDVTPSGSGNVTGGGTYPYGTTVNLQAYANNGYTFSHWQDGITTNPRTVTVTGNTTYTATFAQNIYIITTNVSPTGSGTVTGGGAYHFGDQPTLTAYPNSGYEFVGWQDGNTQNPRPITVTGNATYTACFGGGGSTYYTITATVNPEGAGYVNGDGTFPEGYTTTLTAYANNGYTFDHWNDGSIENPRDVNVNNNLSFTAYFNTQQYTITTDVTPSGSGNVTGGGTYPYGSIINLQAYANSGYEFVGWQDGNTQNPRPITVTGNATYTACFGGGGSTYYTVTATVNPEGAGYVNGDGTFPEGYTTTLTAYANNGYTFDHWNDGSIENPRDVNVNNNLSFTAYFNTQQYTITTDVTPSGSGNVTGGGTYPYSSIINLQAYANSGYEFVGWQDGNTQNPRPITVTGNATYTAHFGEVGTTYYTVSAIINPEGAGTVTGLGPYEDSALCTLTAYANSGFSFVNWTDMAGAVLETESVYSFNVSSNKICIANFTQSVGPYNIIAEASPHNGGIISGTGSFEAEAMCTLIATTNPTYTFEKWTEDGMEVSRENPYQFTVVRDRFLVAVFSQGLFYTITASAGANGTISPSEGDVLVEPGEDMTFTMIPNSGCEVRKVLVDGVDRGPIPSYTFRNVNEDHTIHVEFSGLGVDDNTSLDLKVYPNPAHDKINIQCQNIKQVSIFNLLGVQIESKDVNDDHAVLSTDNLPQGTYILKVENNDGRIGYTRFILVK